MFPVCGCRPDIRSIDKSSHREYAIIIMKRVFSKFFAALLLCVFLILTAGCGTMQIELPGDLSRAGPVVYDVRGRQGLQFGSISFGPYTMTRLDRGFTTTESVGLLAFNASRAGRGFRFELRRPDGPPLKVAGRNRAKWMDLEFKSRSGFFQWGLRGETVTAATISTTVAEWTLVLSGNERDNFWMDGILTDGRRGIRVSPLRRFAGGSWESWGDLGYALEENGRTLAAVETINAGRVFFSPGLNSSDRALLAAACGVLLLDPQILP